MDGTTTTTHQPQAVVLVSGAAGCDGHGLRYLSRLSTIVASRGTANMHVVVPGRRERYTELEDAGVVVHSVDGDFAATQAERFRRFGPAAPVARGVRRLVANSAFLLRASAVLRQLSASGPTVAHFLDFEYLSFAAALRLLKARCPEVRVFATLHPSDFEQRSLDPAGVYKRIVRTVWRHHIVGLEGVFCHGEWIADRLRCQLGVGELGVGRLNAVGYPSEGMDQRCDRTDARSRLGVPSEGRLLLWFGMLRKSKRVDVAIQALAQLPPDVHLVIAGKPTEVSETYVRSLATDLGVQDRLHLFLRYLDEAEIPLFFTAADALLATHDPAFSSASGPVADARSYRLPVVVSNAGQLADYVSRWRVGVVAEQHTASAFATAVVAALDDKGLVKRVDRAADRLSWESFADAHIREYSRPAPASP